MFRYRDHQGLTCNLANEAELQAAIADGRIKPATPFSQGEERWTMASQHPAYQRHRPSGQKSMGGAAKTAAKPEWQKLALKLSPLLALGLGIYTRMGDGKERDALVEAATTMASGQPLPAAVLTTPPKTRAAKQLWVVLTASHDAEQEMMDAERRYGILDTPVDWLNPRYLRQASAYPHIATYFIASQRFHNIYRDSVVPITERALRRRAADARLSGKDLNALIADTRASSDEVATYYAALSQWAYEGQRLHQILVAGERGGILVRGQEVQFEQSYSQNMFNASMNRLVQLEARIDTLELQMQQRSGADLALLTGR